MGMDENLKAILDNLRVNILDCGNSFEKRCVCDKHIANAVTTLKSCLGEQIRGLLKDDYRDFNGTLEEMDTQLKIYNQAVCDVLRVVGEKENK